ncbi:hypothetical protein [Chryseobacterium indoltheticum]|uniref:hypothetical protein n=1 Tax=Chryseobacterium indoltheticum TaxID=254 RepID=UPI003F4918CE
MADNVALVNIYQLFFIISSDLFSNEEIKKFTVLNSLSEKIKIQHNLYLDSDTNRNIIKSTLILSDVYNDAPNLYEKLVIEFKKDDYNFNQDFKLNNTSAYDDLKTDTENLEKIKYLYQAYQNTPLNERFINDVKIRNYLNFKEEDFFLFENSDNLTDLSNRIIEWLGQDNDKKGFFKETKLYF